MQFKQKSLHSLLPKIGIVIPAYNAERYLQDCIKSALQQDYNNLSIYVVDDASTDSTTTLIRKLARQNPRRIVWRENPWPAPRKLIHVL